MLLTLPLILFIVMAELSVGAFYGTVCARLAK